MDAVSQELELALNCSLSRMGVIRPETQEPALLNVAQLTVMSWV
jgi:hypothetical protein